MSKTVNDFIVQYQACTREELIQLEKTKADLVDEAVEALNQVLETRKTELTEDHHTSTNQLVHKRDWAANTASAMAACLGGALAMTFHWGAIPAVVLGAIGWYASRQIVRFVQNGQAPEQRKRLLLWGLTPLYLVMYFVAVVILVNV